MQLMVYLFIASIEFKASRKYLSNGCFSNSIDSLSHSINQSARNWHAITVM